MEFNKPWVVRHIWLPSFKYAMSSRRQREICILMGHWAIDSFADTLSLPQQDNCRSRHAVVEMKSMQGRIHRFWVTERLKM